MFFCHMEDDRKVFHSISLIMRPFHSFPEEGKLNGRVTWFKMGDTSLQAYVTANLT